MPTARDLLRRYRLLGAAVLASFALHAALMMGIPKRLGPVDDTSAAIYSATLDALATAAVIAPAPPASKPAVATARAAAPRARAHRPAPPVHPVAALAAPEPMPVLEPMASLAPETLPDVPRIEELQPIPEKLALAAPVAPPQPEPFPRDAIPAQISIDYTLTSAFADGRASYNWRRDGDNYQITGEAQAEGVFALFLEGRITQESIGTVTATGLRPDRFTERKPGAAPEGVEFDWEGKRAILERNGDKRSEALQENTVDWLSMIFQLAHRPPSGEGMEIRVFTQRKLESYRLQVVGEEMIDVPIGKLKALHLRHVDPKDASQVDVWLGIDQHYVPVKLRFPVAKNRLTVEQVATRISER